MIDIDNLPCQVIQPTSVNNSSHIDMNIETYIFAHQLYNYEFAASGTGNEDMSTPRKAPQVSVRKRGGDVPFSSLKKTSKRSGKD